MNYRISEICQINASNLSKDDSISFINYLDTANLTEGSIEQLQYMATSDVIPSRAKRKVKKNDILISTVRPNQKHYGIIKRIAENMIASTGFAILTPNTDIADPDYLYQYLTQEHITTYLHSIAESSTSTYPSIKPSVIGGLEVALPSITEQKAIAHILSTLDDKIEVNNQINKSLENMAQAIFTRWFVDYEFPHEDDETYKSSGGEMVESEHGMIPKGWEVVRIKDYSESMSNGGTPKRNIVEYWDKKEIPWLKTTEIRDDVIIEAEEWISKEGFKKSSAQLFEKDTVLIAMYGVTAGRLGLLRFESTTNQACCGIVCSSIRSPYYLYLYLKRNQNDLKSLASGSAQQNLSKGIIESFKMILPEKNLLKKFHELCIDIYNKIESNKRINITLTNIRDTLLPKLMSGEIRVPLDPEGEAL